MNLRDKVPNAVTMAVLGAFMIVTAVFYFMNQATVQGEDFSTVGQLNQASVKTSN